jgi:NADH:ubiquinone oxidoreductase subunit 5 (subunit L)/multisubunit Na+/H+ antiporter MnhA subunit
MAEYLFLIPALPLLAFAINFLLGRGLIGDKAHWVAWPATFASFVLSLLVFLDIRTPASRSSSASSPGSRPATSTSTSASTPTS